MSKEKILITGSDGFIGRKVVSKLKENHPEESIICYDKRQGYDLLNKKQLSAFNPDTIIHLAAVIRTENLEEMYKVNVQGTLNVLEHCKKTGAKLIFSSSSGVYAHSEKPIKETHKIKPISHNGLTKLIGEKMCKYYSNNHQVKTIILRIFNPYGPGQKTGFLIPDIISKLKDQEITLGNPHPKRDFIHVDDLAEAIIKSTKLDKETTINLGTGTSHSVKEVAEMITNKEIKFKDIKKINNEIKAEFILSF
jgi:nucleoside-diphosphate-sugar epimerase